MSTVEVVSVLFIVGCLSFLAWRYVPLSWVQTIVLGTQDLVKIMSPFKKNEIQNKGLNAVKNVLVDPDSANFKIEKVSWGSTSAIVCGTINSKNRAGGYVGFRRFYWFSSNGEETIKFEEEHSTSFKGSWDILCQPKADS